MSAGESIVLIVDDDQRMCEALFELLSARGLHSVTFSDISEYLAFPRPDLPACLVLDVELPGINGLEFQKQIERDVNPPIVFITGHGDIPTAVSAMQYGAVDFLTKPFGEAALMAAVSRAIERDQSARATRAELMTLERRLSTLTSREREVLPLIASGLLNKQAAAELGISEVTLQIHRSKILQKMEAASLADLVRAVERLKIPITHSRRMGVARNDRG